MAALEEDIGRIYGLATFDTVQYELEKIGSETGLVLKVRERPWGPNYLQFGLNLSSDFAKSNRFTMRFGYTKIPINSLNGEWRTIFSLGEEPGIETDLYLPLVIGSPWFIEPAAFALNNKYNQFEEDNIVAETSVTRIGAAFALGREFRCLGHLKLGLRRYIGRTEVTIGDPGAPVRDIDGGEIFFDTRFDTLDNIFFPDREHSSALTMTLIRLVLRLSQPIHGENILYNWVGELCPSYNGIAPIPNYFRLGGLFNLPGYSQNELAGQNAALIKTGYLRSLSPLLSMPTYLGATLEYGDVFQDIDDISLSDLQTAASIYLGLNSITGPLYIGYGIAESGEYRVYFTIGGLL